MNTTLPFLRKQRRHAAGTMRHGLSALLLAAIVLAASPAAAFRLTPMTMDFTPSGRGATQSFGVINSTDKPIAVQVWMAHREIAADGSETLKREDEDFIVYPPQMVVMPGKVQVVQVRWLGDAAPATELPYRIVAEQLPIEMDKAAATTGRGAQVTLLLRFEGSVYVLPDNAQPDITLESVRAMSQGAGGKAIEVVLHNQGQAHGFVREPELTLSANDGSKGRVILGPDQLGSALNVNVLAGNRRHVILPWPEGLSEGTVTGVLKGKIVR